MAERQANAAASPKKAKTKSKFQQRLEQMQKAQQVLKSLPKADAKKIAQAFFQTAMVQDAMSVVSVVNHTSTDWLLDTGENV